VIQKLQAVKLKSFDLKKRPSKGTTMKPRKEGPKCPAGWFNFSCGYHSVCFAIGRSGDNNPTYRS